MVDELLDDGKIALAKQLQEVEKKSRHFRKCLLVELAGIGRFNANAVIGAWDEYQSAVEEAEEIVSAEVKPSGLFLEGAER